MVLQYFFTRCILTAVVELTINYYKLIFKRPSGITKSIMYPFKVLGYIIMDVAIIYSST